MEAYARNAGLFLALLLIKYREVVDATKKHNKDTQKEW